MQTITLYKLSKIGQLLEFRVDWGERNTIINHQFTAYVITQKGLFNGSQQIDEYEITEGKNLGKANQTSPGEQAYILANSKVNKLKDKGYIEVSTATTDYDTLYNIVKANTGKTAMGQPLPMLAYKTINNIKFPAYAQRKYDGVRCFGLEATNGDLGRLGIFSRNGKQFHHLNHIVEDLASSLLPGEIVDGELYVHGMPFQTIISSIKREQASNAKIKLRVYDMAHVDEDLSQTRRLRRAKRICRNAGASVEFCPTYIVNNLEEVKKLFAQFIEEGYEGIILRNMDNTYEFGKRSKFMAKYKEFDDDEFLIIGVNEATGRDEGTAIFVCKAKNGQEFRARPMGTRELRAEYYNFPQKYIGKKLTVKYQGLSEEGIPRFPIGKSIRDYE